MMDELNPRYYPWAYVIHLWYYASAYAQWIHEEVRTVVPLQEAVDIQGRLFFHSFKIALMLCCH